MAADGCGSSPRTRKPLTAFASSGGSNPPLSAICRSFLPSKAPCCIPNVWPRSTLGARLVPDCSRLNVGGARNGVRKDVLERSRNPILKIRQHVRVDLESDAGILVAEAFGDEADWSTGGEQQRRVCVTKIVETHSAAIPDRTPPLRGEVSRLEWLSIPRAHHEITVTV